MKSERKSKKTIIPFISIHLVFLHVLYVLLVLGELGGDGLVGDDVITV
mgnify:CR=1 FL=1